MAVIALDWLQFKISLTGGIVSGGVEDDCALQKLCTHKIKNNKTDNKKSRIKIRCGKDR